MPLKIYVDGAYKPSTDQGGWSIVTDDGFEKWNGVKKTTNSRMEIRAVIEALIYLHEKDIREAEIYSDSQYVINTITKNWNKKKNLDLWKIFDSLNNINGVKYFWIKGHSDSELNNRADELAVKGSKLFIE